MGKEMTKIDERAIDLWNKDHYTLQKIAEFFGASRSGVRKYLKKNGIDTSAGGIIFVACDYCKVNFPKYRSLARKTRKHYCCPDHYYASLKANPSDIRHAHGVARKVIRYLFPLEDTYVIHFRNGDIMNVEPENLMVFADYFEFLRWLRLGEDSGVIPLWPS